MAWQEAFGVKIIPGLTKKQAAVVERFAFYFIRTLTVRVLVLNLAA